MINANVLKYAKRTLLGLKKEGFRIGRFYLPRMAKPEDINNFWKNKKGGFRCIGYVQILHEINALEQLIKDAEPKLEV